MKTIRCVYSECTKEAYYYCGRVKHPKHGNISAGWCEGHHPNSHTVNKILQSKSELQYENRMGLLKYNKVFEDKQVVIL